MSPVTAFRSCAAAGGTPARIASRRVDFSEGAQPARPRQRVRIDHEVSRRTVSGRPEALSRRSARNPASISAGMP